MSTSLPNNPSLAPATIDPRKLQQAMREIEYGPDAAEYTPEYVLATIRVNIEVSTADRGKTGDTRPIFEYPLLKRIYSRLGGSARVTGVWMPWREDGDKNKLYRRIWRMTRDDVMDQVEKLTKRFAYADASGKHDVFAEIYGRGSSLTFHKKIKESYDLWLKMITKIRKEGRKGTAVTPDLTDDEYAKVAAVFDPSIEGIGLLSEIELPEIAVPELDDEIAGDLITDVPGVDFGSMVLALSDAGVDPKMINIIDKLTREGNMSEETFRRHGELSGKKPADFALAIDTWKRIKG